MPCENRTASGNVHCTSPPRTVGGGPAASAEAGANVQFRRVLLGPARAREAAGVTVASCVARRLVGATPAAAAPAEAPAEAASVICRGRRLLPSGSPFPVSDPGPAVSRRHRRASLPPARPPAAAAAQKPRRGPSALTGSVSGVVATHCHRRTWEATGERAERCAGGLAHTRGERRKQREFNACIVSRSLHH